MKVLGVMRGKERSFFGNQNYTLDAHCLLTSPEEITMPENEIIERLENFNLGKLTKISNATGLVRTVQINEALKILTVVFYDGSVEIVKCSPNDEFDPEIGFSLAVTRHLYGSKTKVRKLIANTAKVIKAPLPDPVSPNKRGSSSKKVATPTAKKTEKKRGIPAKKGNK